MTFRNFTLLIAAMSFTLNACRENPELVRRRENQRTEIKRLEAEITLLEEQRRSIPTTREEDVAKIRVEVDAQTQEIVKLENTISSLEIRKRQVEKDFAVYKVKYRVTNP